MMAHIEIEGLSKSYGGTMVLKDISLCVERGERIVLLGPSGCGKTTLLRLIAGFMAPDSGTISLGGTPVSRRGRLLVPPEKRGLGMVFQDLALWPHMSVRGNIEFGLKAQGVPGAERAERIAAIAEQVAMTAYLDRKPGELSGGEQQRVALARALVLRPDILLMDEPLSSLDTKLSRHIRAEILQLQSALNFTLLYVTHNPDEAHELATRIVHLDRGDLIEGRRVT